MSDVSEILLHPSDIDYPQEETDGTVVTVVGTYDSEMHDGTLRTVRMLQYDMPDGSSFQEPESQPSYEEVTGKTEEQVVAEIRAMWRERAEIARTQRVTRARRPMTVAVVVVTPRRAPSSGRPAGRSTRTRRSSGSRGDPGDDGEPEPPVAALREEVRP